MSGIAAIDLGATSGRVIAGTVDHGELHMRTVARFPNGPVRLADGLHWDIAGLWAAAMRGLGEASRQQHLTSAAIDAWAVDYGLTRGDHLLGLPMHYRDERNESGVEAVHSLVDARALYQRNGLQHLPFNTVFQFAAEARSGLLDIADGALLIPDLLGWWATGTRVTEQTNASTTGLLSPVTRTWDLELLRMLALPADLLPQPVEPGTDLGEFRGAVREEFGITKGLRLTTVGSHDTASAVVGVPMIDNSGAAYISCGTWSLVGVELPDPLITEGARRRGFTNEGGVDGRTRFLKNVMGLWLLSESVRQWEKEGLKQDLGVLLRQAAEVQPSVAVFDPNDPRLLAPGNMPARIDALLEEQGEARPASIPERVRSILQSLAAAYAATLRDVEELTGTSITVVHLVGGGAQNALLCQLTADATGLPVIAGPVEATAIGNLLVQARSERLLAGDLEALRTVVARSFPPQRFAPRVMQRG